MAMAIMRLFWYILVISADLCEAPTNTETKGLVWRDCQTELLDPCVPEVHEDIDLIRIVLLASECVTSKFRTEEFCNSRHPSSCLCFLSTEYFEQWSRLCSAKQKIPTSLVVFLQTQSHQIERVPSGSSLIRVLKNLFSQQWQLWSKSVDMPSSLNLLFSPLRAPSGRSGVHDSHLTKKLLP